VDVEGRNFQISGDQRVYRLPKSIAVQLFTAQSELISDNSGAIRFFPDGGSTGGRITVRSTQRKYDVDINWLTGQVAIID
jgi:general secretion pathway protein H